MSVTSELLLASIVIIGFSVTAAVACCFAVSGRLSREEEERSAVILPFARPTRRGGRHV